MPCVVYGIKSIASLTNLQMSVSVCGFVPSSLCQKRRCVAAAAPARSLRGTALRVWQQQRARGERQARNHRLRYARTTQHSIAASVPCHRTGRGFITGIGKLYVSLYKVRIYSFCLTPRRVSWGRMRIRCSIRIDEDEGHPVGLLPWQPMMMRIFAEIWHHKGCVAMNQGYHA